MLFCGVCLDHSALSHVRALLARFLLRKRLDIDPSLLSHMSVSSCGFTGQAGNPSSFCALASCRFFPLVLGLIWWQACGQFSLSNRLVMPALPSWTQWLTPSHPRAAVKKWHPAGLFLDPLLPPRGAAVMGCLPQLWNFPPWPLFSHVGQEGN